MLATLETDLPAVEVVVEMSVVSVFFGHVATCGNDPTSLGRAAFFGCGGTCQTNCNDHAFQHKVIFL